MIAVDSLPDPVPDPPEVESVRLWGEVEVEVARLGVAAERFDAALKKFVVHQRRHGFVDEQGRVRSVRRRQQL